MGEGDVSIANFAITEEFDALSLTMEMPFKARAASGMQPARGKRSMTTATALIGQCDATDEGVPH